MARTTESAEQEIKLMVGTGTKEDPIVLNRLGSTRGRDEDEIGLFVHVISKLKMAETLLSEIMLEKSCLCPILVMKGATMARTVLNDSLSNRWNCLNASWSSAFN